METFTKLKPIINNPLYDEQRKRALMELDLKNVDVPIVGLIENIARIPFCFTLQSCYGHFVHNYQKNEKNTEPLSRYQIITKVKYRISYIALCIQGNMQGKELFLDLKTLTSIDPDYVQFGCADWFWNRQVNSYALQVEPDRYKTKDEAILDMQEAFHVEKIRNEFIKKLQEVISIRI
ncbi:hypothetical protein ACFL67_02715 [candidate division KSB1 bacterium]